MSKWNKQGKEEERGKGGMMRLKRILQVTGIRNWQ